VCARKAGVPFYLVHQQQSAHTKRPNEGDSGRPCQLTLFRPCPIPGARTSPPSLPAPPINCTQVLEVAEQMLSDGNLLLNPSTAQAELPRDCPTAVFLSALAEQLAARPPLGSTMWWAGGHGFARAVAWERGLHVCFRPLHQRT
jgi:hypothetical protein